MNKKFAILAVVAALAGCAVGGVGRAFTWEQVQQVQPGMTVAQVTDILGPPIHTAMTPQGTVMSWVYVPPVKVAPFPLPGQPMQTQQASIIFVGGKVADTPK